MAEIINFILRSNMKYFLFLNHPKKENLSVISPEKEEMARKYFDTADTIKTTVKIRGQEYKAKVDFELFANLSNFDCFNCVEHCCGDNPSIYEKQTRDFILDNIDSYNKLTRNNDILQWEDYSQEEIKKSISQDPLMVPDRYVEEEIINCTCSFKSSNSTTLCSIHSICLDRGMASSEIIHKKPIICSLWPMEILAEDDLSMLYITLPDDFTNGFTIENYYTKSCINEDYAASPVFRRENPEGFLEDDYEPFITAYKDTIIHGLGEKCYKDIKTALIEYDILEEDDFHMEVQQIHSKI